MPGGRRFRQARPLRRRHAAIGQAHRPFEFARRDVDQHLVHRPFAEPVFALRGFPAGQSLLLAVEAAKPGTRQLDLAAVETDPALRLAQAVRLAPAAPFMALAAGRQRVLFHHLGERLEPCRKAEPLEARRDARKRLGFDRIGANSGRCGNSLHGVAFLSWNQHPEPNGSRRATPPPFSTMIGTSPRRTRRRTVGKGTPKLREAAERLPPSTAATRVRIASNRSILPLTSWKADFQD